MVLSSEVIIKQWGSQQQLLVNIQNSLPYSQRGVRLLPFQIHVKVLSYALSQYDSQVRNGKFSFLTGTSNKNHNSQTNSPTSKSAHSSTNGGLNSKAEMSSKILSSSNNCVSEYSHTIMRLGYEVYGRVLRCGSDVEGIQSGDLVIGWLGMLIPNNSSYAGDHVLAIYEPEVQAPAWCFFKVPLDVSVPENQLVGAILPGLRAYMAFSGNSGSLRAGESVLITNAASSEAHIAVQIAARRGARVYCTVSSEEEWNLIQDLGVDIERIIDLQREKLKEVILEETGGLGLDWLLDTLGTLSINEIVPIMGVHSRILTTTVEAQYSMAVCRQLLMKNISLSFIFEQTYALASTHQGKLIHMFHQILEDLKQKKIRVNIHGIYAPEKIREAHRQLENPKTLGRVILQYGRD